MRRLARSSGLNHQHGQGKLFVARRCVLSCRLNESLRAVQLAVFHQFTASTKKEKRSKKERKLLLRLGIQFAPIGALNTYKGKRGQEPLAPPWVSGPTRCSPLPPNRRFSASRGERSGEGGRWLSNGESRVSLFSKHFLARSVSFATQLGPSPSPQPSPPTQQNGLGERVERVWTLTQGGAQGDSGPGAPASRLPWATIRRPARGSMTKKRPPAASQMSNLQERALRARCRTGIGSRAGPGLRRVDQLPGLGRGGRIN